MLEYNDLWKFIEEKPPTKEFSSLDLPWFDVKAGRTQKTDNGWHQNVDSVAVIPYSRVDDFRKGENSRADCPTRFRVDSTHKKPRSKRFLESKRYHCQYGPDDYREGGQSRPSRKCMKPSKKKCTGRPLIKRGCLCHFVVKRPCLRPSVALIIYNEKNHVDKSGCPCHGPLERHGGPSNRDDLLSHNSVRNLERDIRLPTYELHSDDAVSVKMWVKNHRKEVFCYSGSSDTDDFILGIQTEWQLQQMIYFGNNKLLAVHSSFGVKEFKYPVHTLLVFDSKQIAIPIAWIISARFSSHDVPKWMKILHHRVCMKESSWRLSGFIVDDASTETVKIGDVFQCLTLLCLWHLRRAWHRNIKNKCTDSKMQWKMLKCLGDIMCSEGSGSNVLAATELKKDFEDQRMPKIEMWVTATRTLPLASQETYAAIEAFHSKLNSKMFNEADTDAYQRIDWLVHKLTTEVHSYYLFDHFSEENDLSGYMRDGELASNSWHRALQIADSDVILDNKDLQSAKVVSQSDRSQTHTVWNPGTEFAICDCPLSLSRGNFCEHAMKARRVCCDRKVATPSRAMQTYNQVLQSLSQCTLPDDSIVLDHAVALVTHVEQYLKRLMGPSNHRGTDPPLKREPSNHTGIDPPRSWLRKKNRSKVEGSTGKGD